MWKSQLLLAILLVGLVSIPPAYAVRNPGSTMKGTDPTYTTRRGTPAFGKTKVQSGSCAQGGQNCKAKKQSH